MSPHQIQHTDAAHYISVTIDRKHWADAFVPCARYGRVANSVGESANNFISFFRSSNPTEAVAMFVRAVSEKMVKRRMEYTIRGMQQAQALSSGFTGFVSRATQRLQAQQRVGSPLNTAWLA